MAVVVLFVLLVRGLLVVLVAGADGGGAGGRGGDGGRWVGGRAEQRLPAKVEWRQYLLHVRTRVPVRGGLSWSARVHTHKLRGTALPLTMTQSTLRQWS
jgi:hypothetical protein